MAQIPDDTKKIISRLREDFEAAASILDEAYPKLPYYANKTRISVLISGLNDFVHLADNLNHSIRLQDFEAMGEKLEGWIETIKAAIDADKGEYKTRLINVGNSLFEHAAEINQLIEATKPLSAEELLGILQPDFSEARLIFSNFLAGLRFQINAGNQDENLLSIANDIASLSAVTQDIANGLVPAEYQDRQLLKQMDTVLRDTFGTLLGYVSDDEGDPYKSLAHQVKAADTLLLKHQAEINQLLINTQQPQH